MRRPLEIREIRPDDLPGVYLLGKELFPGPGCPPATLPWNKKNLAGILAEETSRSFVAARKKKIEGFLIGVLEDGDPGCAAARILWLGGRGTDTAEILTGLYRAFVESLPGSIRGILAAVPASNGEMIDIFGKFGFTDSEHVVIMGNFFRKNT